MLKIKRQTKVETTLSEKVEYGVKSWNDNFGLIMDDKIETGYKLAKAESHGYLEGESKDDRLDRIEANLRELGLV